MLDNTHLQYHLELIFASPQIYKSLGHTARKIKLFVDQKEYYALDSWTRIEDADNQFFQEIESFFCVHNFFSAHNSFQQNTFPIFHVKLLSYEQSGWTGYTS